MPGELKKMVIEAYLDADRLIPVADYKLMLNPKNFSRSVNMQYEDPMKPGTFSAENIFKKVDNESISIEFLIDGIGTTGEKRDVTTDVEKFLLVCGKVPGGIKRPNFLRLHWGSLVMSAVLVSANINYTLFKPDGTPIRAMISATFTEDRSKLVGIIEDGVGLLKNTNFREMVDGIGLPQMCKEIYGDESLYIQVAKANGITNPRDIPAGTEIEFPPEI